MLQPYFIDSASVAALDAYCQAHNLMWHANGCSPYAPGSTLTIIVEAAGRDRPQLPWLDGNPMIRGKGLTA